MKAHKKAIITEACSNIKDKIEMNTIESLFENDSYDEYTSIQTKKYLSETVGRIKDILLTEGIADGISNNVKLAGAGAAGLAAGAGGLQAYNYMQALRGQPTTTDQLMQVQQPVPQPQMDPNAVAGAQQVADQVDPNAVAQATDQTQQLADAAQGAM